MSVANELTSEVTDFVLRNEDPSKPENLRRVLLEFHTTLRALSVEDRRRRRAKISSETLSAHNRSAALTTPWQ